MIGDVVVEVKGVEKEGAIEGKEDDDSNEEEAVMGDAVELPDVEEVPFVALSLAETEGEEVEGEEEGVE